MKIAPIIEQLLMVVVLAVGCWLLVLLLPSVVSLKKKTMSFLQLHMKRVISHFRRENVERLHAQNERGM